MIMIASKQMLCLLATSVLVCTATGASAYCSVQGAEGVAGAVAEMKMTVTPGANCVVRHFTGDNGPIGNRRFPQTHLDVKQGPKNGSLSVQGSRLTYRANPGFKGADSFVYVSDNSNLKHRSYTYRVAINVD
jgi:Bacterial Ig domain